MSGPAVMEMLSGEPVLVVVFGGVRQGIGIDMPPFEFLRSMAGHKCDAISLRDFKQAWYQLGAHAIRLVAEPSCHRFAVKGSDHRAVRAVHDSGSLARLMLLACNPAVALPALLDDLCSDLNVALVDDDASNASIGARGVILEFRAAGTLRVRVPHGLGTRGPAIDA